MLFACTVANRHGDEKVIDKNSARFALRAIKGSSLQNGAMRVARAASAMEEQITVMGKERVHAFQKLEAEFAGFIEIFDEYLLESMRSPADVTVAVLPSIGSHKSHSAEVAPRIPAAEHDMNSLSKTI